MKITRILSSTVAIATLATLAITQSTAGAAEAKKKVLIGFVAKSLSNDVFQAAQVGAADAAKELGPKYGVEVQLEIRTPNDEDATKQAEAIEALARMGAQGIAVSCSEANTVTPSIDKAVGKGAAVMCFDSDAPNSKRFAYYGTDDKACGQKTVDVLAKAMGGERDDRDPGGQPERAEPAKPGGRSQGGAGEVSQHEAEQSWGLLPCGDPGEGGGGGAKRAERQPGDPGLGDDWRVALVYGGRLEMAGGLDQGGGGGRAAGAAQLREERLRGGAPGAGLLRLGDEVGGHPAQQDSSTTRRRRT
jgi:ABC-type sugar transport system, periplasmic component